MTAFKIITHYGHSNTLTYPVISADFGGKSIDEASFLLPYVSGCDYSFDSEHIRFEAGHAAVLPKSSCRASGCALAPRDLARLCRI